MSSCRINTKSRRGYQWCRYTAAPVRVLIAPDSFSGTLTAAEAAAAMTAGWRRARPQDELVAVPMSDGGEGFVDVVAKARPESTRRSSEVADARGIATTAQWLLLPDGTAVIESAQACGLHRLAPDRRDPLLTTTYGVGQLLRAAADAGATRIIVGLGGSATVDAGLGAATALGCELRRADGNGVKVGGRWTGDLDHIAGVAALGVPIVCAADVGAPLLGPNGAARVHGPQKGADAEAVELLEANLAHVADVVERDLDGGPWRDLPGAGAAGGLAFGLAAFAGAQLRPGATETSGLVGLEAALEAVDLVLTGEGRMDPSSARGKVCGYLAGCAATAGAKVAAVVGSVESGAEEGYDAVATLESGGSTESAKVAAAAQALAARLGA